MASKSIPTNLAFNTAPFFVGGAGYFLQYHDVLKPVWLYAVFKLIVSGESFGLPIDIITHMSVPSLLEWYINRRYPNPLRQLDWSHIIPAEELDSLLKDLLFTDSSLYKLTPMLNLEIIFQVYRQQHMSFPVYVYTEEFEPYVKEDCEESLPGITVRYVYGDLKKAIAKCDQNFTYIFSDIELVKQACEVLTGAYSHILLTSDYRYNYKSYHGDTKYDLKELMFSHPFVRLGTTSVWDQVKVEEFYNVTNVDVNSDDYLDELDEDEYEDDDEEYEDDDIDDDDEEEDEEDEE